jgi:hypothetical protein
MFIEEMRRNGATAKMKKSFADDGTPKIIAAG